MCKVVNGVAITIGILSFVAGFFIELCNFNLQSCWMFAVAIFAVAVVFYPRSVKRISKKYSFWFNTLVFCNALMLLVLCGFLMANLIYFALYGFKLMEGYQLILYPLILVFCLVETYIDYIIKEKFKHHLDNEYFD